MSYNVKIIKLRYIFKTDFHVILTRIFMFLIFKINLRLNQVCLHLLKYRYFIFDAKISSSLPFQNYSTSEELIARLLTSLVYAS